MKEKTHAGKAVTRAGMPLPDFRLERSAGGIVAGIDEAGRGPWAGPVVAAAVIVRHTTVPEGLNDSKRLSPRRRVAIHDWITASCDVGVGVADVEEIDRLNILQATLRAMARAVENLPRRPDVALVDGNCAPFLPCPVRTVIRGDTKSVSIAAASIVAKVTRDRTMARLSKDFPAFGWDRNAGYGTAEHRNALAAFGPTPHHRTSFAPIRQLIAKSYLTNS